MKNLITQIAQRPDYQTWQLIWRQSRKLTKKDRIGEQTLSFIWLQVTNPIKDQIENQIQLEN